MVKLFIQVNPLKFGITFNFAQFNYHWRESYYVYLKAHVHRNFSDYVFIYIIFFLFIQQFWQVLSSSFYYSSTRNLICGSFLLYTFRIFERRFGSRKYAVSNSMKFVLFALLGTSFLWNLKQWNNFKNSLCFFCFFSSLISLVPPL